MKRWPWRDWGRWERLWWDDDPEGPPGPLPDESDELEVEEPPVDTVWDRRREDLSVRGREV